MALKSCGRLFKPSSVLSFAGVRAFATEGQKLKRTALYDLHIELGGKMVEFAGWEMPVQYKDSLINSHLHCRSSASLFDVSHMGQLRMTGKDRIAFIESLVPGDIAGLENDNARLTQFTNEKGGILDDTIVTKREDHLFIIINAGCTDSDLEHLGQHIKKWKAEGKDVDLEVLSDRSLVALQGPKAASVLQRLTQFDLSTLNFMSGKHMDVMGAPCIVTRCGYTGEDGFEISMPSDKAVALTRAMLEQPEVLPCGLGPRDSLRLEAGLCLMGHDMNSTITPIEASLAWSIGKRRRAEGNFPGADVILAQIRDGVSKKRVGFNVTGAPAREHSAVLNEKGEKIGEITSGTFSPSLKRPIAMGYVETASSANGTKVKVEVRGKVYDAEVTKMPFVAQSYYRAPGTVAKK